MSKVYLEYGRIAVEDDDGIGGNIVLAMALLKTGSTAGAEEATTLAGFTTLNRYDGENYTDRDLPNVTVTKNVVAGRIEVTWDPEEYEQLGAPVGGGQGIAALVYWKKTNDSDHVPMLYVDEGFPFNGTGSKLTVSAPTDGGLKATPL